MKARAQDGLRLRVQDGEERPLPAQGTLVIGCSAERAAFVVDGQGVEDAHCAIGKIRGGGWAIKDLGSRYGTLVNGERVESARLHAGDEILLGSRRLEVLGPAGAAPAQKAPAAEKKELGRIGGYRLEKLLGRGGMGLVYLALQESLKRPVALKVLSQKLAADHDFVRRFQKEARAAAALNHPNVVVVHDVGAADGHHFLSMEYMAGGSVEKRIAEVGALPWRQALDVIHDAARGLTFAEERGIVHRDIKPDNLMLAGNGTVKIADLGLATSIEAEAEGQKIFGTPHFISPEQARGENVDHRSDLYSLGATAYRILTGRTPFEGETTKEILLGHFQREVTPPSAVVADLPPGIESFVLRLLAKNPAERFDSAQTLVQEIERIKLEADHGALALGTQKSRWPLFAAGVLVLGAGAAAALWLGSGGESDAAVVAEAQARAMEIAETPNDFLETPDDSARSEVDEDRQLRVRELEAEVALGRIATDLEGDLRIEALRKIADDYPATSAASSAREEIATLAEAAQRSTNQDARLQAALTQAKSALQQAVGWPLPEGLPPTAEMLASLDGYQAPAELSGNPALARERADLRTRIVSASLQAYRDRLGELDARAAAGDFDALGAGLTEISTSLDADRLAVLEGTEELALLARGAGERLARLETERSSWQRARTLADRSSLARHLGAPSDTWELLRRVDLAAVESRLSSARESLASPDAHAWVDSLEADLASARQAMAMLVTEYQQGNWRRSRVTDPRAGRSAPRDCVGANADGLSLEEGGQAELVAWSEFGRDPDFLHRLFHERLERDYSRAERAGIATLLRILGAAQVVESALPYLAPQAPQGLKGTDEQTIREAFVEARMWDEEDSAVLAEDEAARTLLAALRAAQVPAWSECTAHLERLLGELEGTWIVLLLFDGSDWADGNGE